MSKKKLKKTVHCPVCSGEIEVNRKGRLVPHLHGAKKCVFGGQPFAPVDSLNNSINNFLKERKK